MGRQFAISTGRGLARSIDKIPSIRSPSDVQVMRAIRFESFGDPSVLKFVEVPAPAADEMTAVVRVMAASINPSDVKNVAGAMKQTTLPRIPGRDFAGVTLVRACRGPLKVR